MHPVFEVLVAPDVWKASVDDIGKGEFSERDRATLRFHNALLPVLRDATGSFKNVTPTTNNWKSGAVGIGGVSVTYGPRKTSTYVQVWFSKANSAKVNHAGLSALEDHRAELEAGLPGFVMNWRRNDATGILEIIVDGVGYETELTPDRLEPVALVASHLAKVVRNHQAEITAAMSAGTSGAAPE
ncbi:MAG: DUF4268 domain-containing protein [Actinomycetes bacterium]